MEYKQKIIKCDFCKRVVFYEDNDKKDDFLLNTLVKCTLDSGISKIQGDFCSSPCFVLGAWSSIKKVNPEDKSIVEELLKVMPNWKIEPPNYKEINRKKTIEDVKYKIRDILSDKDIELVVSALEDRNKVDL